jgi:opacity protein-like surface antigen
MDERGANIDIVFRNGLKDYEVLPPQDVWKNIQPVIRKKQKPLAVLRAAAMFAVLISLSFLAYKFSREIPAGLEGPVMVSNPESYAPPAEIISATIPDNAISQNFIPASGTVPDDQVVKPVNTDNIVPAVKEFESTPESNKLQNNRNKQADLPVLDYNGSGYLEINPGNSLDMPDYTDRKGPDRWTISALISPTYQSQFSSGQNDALSQAMASEQTIISYSGGLALAYKINKRLSIQSGLYYSTIGKELTGIAAYSGFENQFYTKGSPNFTVLTSSGTVHTSNNDIFLTDGLFSGRIHTDYNINVFDPVKASLTYLDNSIRQNFSYLELPVVLRYKVIDKALDFNIIGGLSSNLLVDNSVYASSGKGKTLVGSTEGMNMITFSSTLGMGMEYNFSGNLSLNLEPTFRYYINPFNNIPGMSIHPYTFGIFSGLSYKF